MVAADFPEQFANIDQIRKILFGDQMSEYEVRLDQLEENLSDIQTKLDERISAVQAALSDDLRGAVAGLERLIKSQGLQEARERTGILNKVEQVNRRLSAGLGELDESIHQDFGALQDDLLNSRQKLYDELKKLESKVSAELEKSTSTLTKGKLARGDLAEMFFELGLKLNAIDEVAAKADDAATDQRTEYLLPESSEPTS